MQGISGNDINGGKFRRLPGFNWTFAEYPLVPELKSFFKTPTMSLFYHNDFQHHAKFQKKTDEKHGVYAKVKFQYVSIVF